MLGTEGGVRAVTVSVPWGISVNGVSNRIPISPLLALVRQTMVSGSEKQGQLCPQTTTLGHDYFSS